MSRLLQMASKLEMRAVIRFFGQKRCNSTFIGSWYGENAIWCQAISKRRNVFKNGHTNIHEAYREGKPSTSTNVEIIAHVNERILSNRHVMFDQSANELDISHGNVHKITFERLEIPDVCSKLNSSNPKNPFSASLNYVNVTK
ncbi:hypothetical protein AVEN_164910-1, partial [Araneus ventricosus]